MKYYRGFKIRIYPTEEQEKLILKHIGSCRFIWNYMLDLQQKRYENKEKYLSAFDMMKKLTSLKKDGEHSWLYEVSNTSLQVVCKDLNESFQNFFSKIAGHPKFKSKKDSKQSYPIDSSKLWFDKNGFAHIIKLKKVKFKTDFNLPIGTNHKFIDARISKVGDKWMLSFNMEIETQDNPELNESSLGIDLGIKELAVISFNEKPIIFHNINKSREIRRLKSKLKHLQRKASRKYEENKVGNEYVKTNNILKTEEAIRKIYRRISNIRKNYLHQTTHDIVSLLPNAIIMEDLNVSGMMKNRHLSKAIQEQCFYEFIRQIKYKSERLGIKFIQVDRFYPSSKTCSHCGNIKKDLKLSDRTYICDKCGTVIDRDFNAALNLSRYKV